MACRASALATLVACTLAVPAYAADVPLERGKYLTQIAGCTDCHTPGHFFGHPDMTRYLGDRMLASRSRARGCSSART